MNDNSWGREQQHQQAPGECVRLFVTIRKDSESNVEYRKLTIMAQLNIKISMLKRHIEREFSDLFPHEPTFICAKLEDEFGYSLSNTSLVHELLKHSDRLFAIPESFTKDLIGKMHVTHDLNELTFMLKSIVQTIIAKLAEAELGSPQTQLDILQLVVPIGFSLQQKAINHNTAIVIKRIAESERLQFIEDPSYALVTQLLVKLLQFWTNDLIFQDQFLLNLTVDILELLLKSAAFSTQFKNPQSINSLMGVSKLDFVSAQTRSRIIKLISYLSRPTFQNSYQAKPFDGPIDMPQSRLRRGLKASDVEEQKDYVPYLMQRRPPSNRRFEQSRVQSSNSQSGQQSGGVDYQNGQQQQQSQLQTYQQPHPQPQQQYSQVQPYSQVQQQSQYYNQSQPQQDSRLMEYQSDQNGRQFDNKQALRPRTHMQYDANQQVFDGLITNYLDLLSSDSNEDMIQFAVQNLSDGIETTIHQIMDNKEAFQKVVNLLEVAISPNFIGQQLRILEAISKNMNEARAKEATKLKLIPRVMKAFTYQPKEFQGVLYDILSATLKLSDFQVDVITVVSLIESPYQRISALGIKIMALMSDPNRFVNNNIAIQFENYVKSLMEWTLDGQRGEDFQYNALVALANLALNDTIRPQVLHLKGIDFFLRVLRESYRVDAQRMAAKGLLNLSIKSRDTKLSIVSEMGDEIKRLHKGDMDTVVAGYLQTLLANRDRGQLL